MKTFLKTAAVLAAIVALVVACDYAFADADEDTELVCFAGDTQRWSSVAVLTLPLYTGPLSLGPCPEVDEEAVEPPAPIVEPTALAVVEPAPAVDVVALYRQQNAEYLLDMQARFDAWLLVLQCGAST